MKTDKQSRNTWASVLLAVTCIMTVMPRAYSAADIYVTPDGTDATGASWAAPTSLTNALAIAATSNVIWMAQGSYTNASTFSIATDGLQIYGGFDGTETDISQRDWVNHAVLLDGQDARLVMDIQANDILLDGLTITNGHHTGATSVYGAGLLMNDSGSNLTMLNCRIVDNYIDLTDNGQCFGVGAYFNNAGTVLLSNTVFRANQAELRGQGVGFYSKGTTLTVIDCEVRDSYDEGGDQRPGKGFRIDSGTLTMINTIVAGNYYDSDDSRRPGPGGGGYIGGGDAVFRNCVFTGNDSDRSDGSGLYVNTGNVTIENCTFAANGTIVNREESRGGAIFQNSGTVTIRNSIFWGNEAGTSATAGDTIYQNSGTLNISDSCMDGTEAPRVFFVSGTWGDGIITNNPLFATEYTDVHLKSTVGRWDGSGWVTTDTENSPCIDAGDPDSDFSNEPTGANGARINMGAYGNTAEASKSLDASPTVETQAARVVATAAELKGVLTAGASSTVTFYYGQSDPGATATGWDETIVLSEAVLAGNAFSSVAGGLEETQTYWFRVYATNAFGEDWSDAASFSTGTAAPGGGAGVIHVDADAGGVPDGTSWTNAFTAFEDALAAADDGLGTSIWVAEGSYSWKGEPFVIQANGLSVYGGFDGTEALLSERAWTSRPVLLDGGGSTYVLDVKANNVLLDALTITNGFEEFANGAGIRMDNSGTGLTLLNCRVVGNHHKFNDRYGGGAYFYNAGNVLVSNSVFQGNWSTQRGNGVGFYSRDTTLTLLDSEILENYSTGDQRKGKGFYLYNGTLTMVGCTVADQYMQDDDSGPGGGGYIRDGSASFTNCIFRSNDCRRSDGGALYIGESATASATFENCTFVANGGRTDHSSPEGGAIYMNNGTITIKNSIFWDNQTGQDPDDGDTIYQKAGTLNISYSCMDGTNTPRLVSAGGTLALTDGVITNNPLFAVEYTDVHLKSRGGRWDGASWVTGDVTSPCIDAGDPASGFSLEPSPNGGRINMGAYGNTAEASISYNERAATILILR